MNMGRKKLKQRVFFRAVGTMSSTLHQIHQGLGEEGVTKSTIIPKDIRVTPISGSTTYSGRLVSTNTSTQLMRPSALLNALTRQLKALEHFNEAIEGVRLCRTLRRRNSKCSALPNASTRHLKVFGRAEAGIEGVHLCQTRPQRN